jgi:hypothetical protein
MVHFFNLNDIKLQSPEGKGLLLKLGLERLKGGR